MQTLIIIYYYLSLIFNVHILKSKYKISIHINYLILYFSHHNLIVKSFSIRYASPQDAYNKTNEP